MEHGAWSMEHGAWSMEHGAFYFAGNAKPQMSWVPLCWKVRLREVRLSFDGVDTVHRVRLGVGS